MDEITIIKVEEYKELLKNNAVIEAFKRYVQKSKTSIDREICAAYFGFDLPKSELEVMK